MWAFLFVPPAGASEKINNYFAFRTTARHAAGLRRQKIGHYLHNNANMGAKTFFDNAEPIS